MVAVPELVASKRGRVCERFLAVGGVSVIVALLVVVVVFMEASPSAVVSVACY